MVILLEAFKYNQDLWKKWAKFAVSFSGVSRKVWQLILRFICISDLNCHWLFTILILHFLRSILVEMRQKYSATRYIFSSVLGVGQK